MSNLAHSTIDAPRDEPPGVLAEVRWTDLPSGLAEELAGSSAAKTRRVALALATAEAIERRAMYALHTRWPLDWAPSSAGWAAGEDAKDAQMRASLEVIERVSFCNFLRGDDSLIEVPADILSYRNLERYRLAVELYRITRPSSVAVIIAHLVDESGRGPRSSVGIAADLSEAAAADRALNEATKARLWAYTIDRRLAPTADWDRPVERLMYYAAASSTEVCRVLFRQALVDSSLGETHQPSSDQERMIRAASDQLNASLSLRLLPTELQDELPVECPLAYVVTSSEVHPPPIFVVEGMAYPNPLA